MKSMLKRPGAWFLAAALLLTAGIVAGCSAMPVLQGNLDDVVADQQEQAEAAEDGNVLRTVLFSLSALAGSIGVAVKRQRSYDAAPFEGEVDGRKVSVPEGDLVKVVEAARKKGDIS